jgi:hypothetical protein
MSYVVSIRNDAMKACDWRQDLARFARHHRLLSANIAHGIHYFDHSLQSVFLKGIARVRILTHDDDLKRAAPL